MANPTTYFGWVMPTATDLVTDLPADFNVFGQGVDTSMQDLLGGTTGQILSKTSGTNMDFTWINNDQGDITGVTAGTGISGGGTSGAVTVTNSMATAITTAGDLIKGTGSGTFDRLGIGSTGQVLTVAAGAPSWATPATSNKVIQVLNFTYSTYQTRNSTTMAATGITLSITPTSATSTILIMCGANISKAGTASLGARMALYRATSSIKEITSATWYGANIAFGSTVSLNYIDSPATTSATTYTIYFASENTAGLIELNNTLTSASSSYITLMEIGA